MKQTERQLPLFWWLEIETQGSCNRTCQTCLRQSYPDKNNPTFKGRFPVTSRVGEGMKMPTDIFKSIIDQSVEMGFTGIVNLQHFNEPLLDERLAELASYVKSKPEISETRACSNMDLITKETAKELDGLIDQWQVALYMSPEKQQKRKPYIQNLFKKSQIVFTKGGAGPTPESHLITHNSPLEGTAEAVNQVRHWPCTNYNPMLIIAYDGTVLHCCDDHVGHFGLGNVNHATIREIWDSVRHKKLVTDLSEPLGRLKHDYCANCPRDGAWGWEEKQPKSMRSIK